jgi:hypothetical protein
MPAEIIISLSPGTSAGELVQLRDVFLQLRRAILRFGQLSRCRRSSVTNFGGQTDPPASVFHFFVAES